MNSHRQWRDSTRIVWISLRMALIFSTILFFVHESGIRYPLEIAICGFIAAALLQTSQQERMLMEQVKAEGFSTEGQTKRIINISPERRLIYGYDSQDVDNPYFIKIINPDTGGVIRQKGFNEDLEKEELILILDQELPITEEGKDDPFAHVRKIIEEDKISIAAGLPF